MQNKRIRRLATPITVGAVVGLTLLSGVPAYAAPATTNFKASCLATPSAIADPTVQTEDAFATVDAPEQVAPGDIFEVVIAYSPITYPNSASGASVKNVSRLKVDIDIPQNAEFLSAEAVAGTSSGLSGVAPNVLRVNESGVVDPNGTILRLSGNNQTIGNGPSSSKNSEGGIVAKASSGSKTTFQLPHVRARLRAGASGEVNVKLRTGGEAGTFGNDKNYLTFLPKATLFITAWAPTQCTPRDNKTAPLNTGAGPLSTTRIVEADKVTTTTVTAPTEAKVGQDVNLTAKVEPAGSGGTVEFVVDDGAPIQGMVGTDGVAVAPYTFTSAGTHMVVAKFTGTTGFSPSTSPAFPVSVTDPVPVDIETTTTLDPVGTVQKNAPVVLEATVAPDNAQGTVQFKLGDTPIGAPVTVENGVATFSTTFTNPGTYSVTAEFTGAPGFLSSAAPPQTVTVPRDGVGSGSGGLGSGSSRR
ncbi:Ig-like domain-containing protein [Nocardia sp. 004]|uniref:Ig-like domain-containing protein n=1 Tax=Nocardia sp. 004 TaxID=3385978 RepID=UPI0039A139E0